jgi:uncharacterized protein with HEPN domain
LPKSGNYRRGMCKIHPDIKAAYPMVEWRAMSDMSNKIIHFYFGIDYDVVWDTVKTDIPVLEQSIRVILSDQSNLLRSYTTID